MIDRKLRPLAGYGQAGGTETRSPLPFRLTTPNTKRDLKSQPAGSNPPRSPPAGIAVKSTAPNNPKRLAWSRMPRRYPPNRPKARPCCCLGNHASIPGDADRKSISAKPKYQGTGHQFLVGRSPANPISRNGSHQEKDGHNQPAPISRSKCQNSSRGSTPARTAMAPNHPSSMFVSPISF